MQPSMLNPLLKQELSKLCISPTITTYGIISFCHQTEELVIKMNNDESVHGLPKLHRYSKRAKCLCCGMGKSTNAHVGPINHSDVKRKAAEIAKKDEYHDSE